MYWKCAYCSRLNRYTTLDEQRSLLQPNTLSDFCGHCLRKQQDTLIMVDFKPRSPPSYVREIGERHGAELALWIGQTDDPMVLEDMHSSKESSFLMKALSTLTEKVLGATLLDGGVCHAVTMEWIRINLLSGAKSFLDLFEDNVVPIEFVDLQHSHHDHISLFKATIDEHKKISQQWLTDADTFEKDVTQKRITNEQAVSRRRSLDTLFQKAQRLEREVMRLQHATYEIGMEELGGFPCVWVKEAVSIPSDSKSMALGLIQAMTLYEGYYAINLYHKGSGSSGHTFGFEYCIDPTGGRPQWRLLDANTGEYRLKTTKQFLRFFADYYDELYRADFKSGYYHLIWYPNHTFARAFGEDVRAVKSAFSIQ